MKGEAPDPSLTSDHAAGTAGIEATVRFRFQSLHALRGVCAIMVAALHLRTTGYLHESMFIQNSYRFEVR